MRVVDLSPDRTDYSARMHLAAAALSLLIAASGADALQGALQLEKGGEDEKALSALDALVDESPAWELPRMEAARLRLKLGRDLDRAQFDLEVARAMAPENPRVHYLYGLAREEAKADAEAITAYRTALALRPTLDDARLRLAGILFADGDVAGAEAEYRALASRRPEWTQARLQWAVTLEQLGHAEEAESVLAALHRDEPASKLFTRKLADFYERTGRTHEAEKLRAELDPQPAKKLRPLKKSRR